MSQMDHIPDIPEQPDDYPKITVVIPVRNEEKFIAQTLDYILTQDYPKDKLEVIVADGFSPDRTREIVTEIASRDNRVKLLDNPVRRSSAGRNIGARAATGEIITFIDGHTYIDNDQLLKNIVSLMRKHDLKVLSRPQFLDTPENDYFQRAVSLARKSIIGHGLDSTIYTEEDRFVDPASSGATYAREVFEDIGYYDERFDACEDVEFNVRTAKSGYKSFTSLKTAVYYYPRQTIGALFGQLKRYGVGRFRLACKHPGTLSIGTLIPAAITAGIPLTGLLSFIYPMMIPVFSIAAGLYLLLILGWSLAIALKQDISYLGVLPGIYIAIHTGLGWGFLSEMLKFMTGQGISFARPDPSEKPPS